MGSFLRWFLLVMLVPLLLASPTGCSQPETGDPPKVEPGPKKREKKPDEPPKSPEPIVPPSLSGLNFPTEVSVAADGLLYFTEKSGALRVVRPGAAEPETILSVDVPDLAGYHETGLLGMALSPSFSEDGLVYLYTPISTRPGSSTRLSGSTLTPWTVRARSSSIAYREAGPTTGVS